ncbi:MAG: arsenate reductase ArsC [Rhodospirillaceae bacterium]|nr:arsenate reductase ArsC [Rhodospirillaceae bacterium]
METTLPGAVLFSCTQNSIRSPIAEGLLKDLHGTEIYVDSVGVRALEVNGFAIEVMAELGIDITKHKAKTFDDLEDSSFDLVISLSPHAQHKAVELTRFMACEVEFWHTFDPSVIDGSRDVRLDAYRAVRDELKKRILERFPVAQNFEI